MRHHADMQDHESKDVDIARALTWIVGQFESLSAPYQIVGGLAARAWGGTRDVVDIDLYAPFDRAQSVLTAISPYVVWGPERYRSDCWDLTFLKLDFAGQRLEVGDSASSPRFFNVVAGVWEDQVIDIESSDRLNVLGTTCCVIPKAELIRYKRALDRPVDRLDVAQLEGI
ncbi:MAG: hypothetical protein ABI323_03735 [Solirubrobacteraceae bacterium]